MCCIHAFVDEYFHLMIIVSLPPICIGSEFQNRWISVCVYCTLYKRVLVITLHWGWPASIAWSIFLHLKPISGGHLKMPPLHRGPRAHTQSHIPPTLRLLSTCEDYIYYVHQDFASFSSSLTSHFAVRSTATPTSACVFSLFLPFICFVCVTSIGASVRLPSRIYYTTWSGTAYTSICAAMTTVRSRCDLSQTHSQITAVMWPPHAMRIESHCAKTLMYAHVDVLKHGAFCKLI